MVFNQNDADLLLGHFKIKNKKKCSCRKKNCPINTFFPKNLKIGIELNSPLDGAITKNLLNG